jgi:hypothetical protein
MTGTISNIDLRSLERVYIQLDAWIAEHDDALATLLLRDLQEAHSAIAHVHDVLTRAADIEYVTSGSIRA